MAGRGQKGFFHLPGLLGFVVVVIVLGFFGGGCLVVLFWFFLGGLFGCFVFFLDLHPGYCYQPLSSLREEGKIRIGLSVAVGHSSEPEMTV